MNTEERRLADWLHQTAPEPPRQLTMEQIAERVAPAPERAAPARRWLPLWAAASVVAVAAATVLVVVLRDNRGQRPVAPAPTSVRPTQSTTTATPPPSTVGPWEATPVGGGAAGEVPLLGTGDSLYARDDRGIVRIDPGTGRVVARRDYPVAGGLTDAVLAAGVLWVSPTSKADGTATLQGFEPGTLAPSASVRLRFNGPSGVASLAAAPDGRRLYAALGNTIDVVDTTTLQVVNQYAVSGGYVLDVAVNADGTRLYVAVHVAEMDARIDVLDAASGTPIMTRNHAGNIVNNIGLVASAGGLWLQTGGGHSDHVGFLAGPDLRPTDTGTDLEIGGRPITVTVANGGVWLAAPNSIACADPVSGRVRAHTSVPPRGGSTAGILDIEYARGQLFGYYRAGGPGFLVRLSPPPQCTP